MQNNILADNMDSDYILLFIPTLICIIKGGQLRRVIIVNEQLHKISATIQYFYYIYSSLLYT